MKTFFLSPRTKKSGITKRRENIDELFLTTIYRRPIITKIYDKTMRILNDHDKAKERTRALLNRLS
jgi:hypothetical protein